MNDEHYIDGQHNKGVFDSFNNNSYIYCYQNPIKLIDPNGKQVDSRSLFYTEFSNKILSFASIIDDFFHESKQSITIAEKKASVKLGVVNAEINSKVQIVHKEKTKPNLKGYLKTSLYNQQTSDKSQIQTLPSITNTTTADYMETSSEAKATVTTEFGQTTVSVKASVTDKNEKAITKTTITQGIGENGVYFSQDSEGNKETGVKTKNKVGAVTTEQKVGYETKR